ncbi:hypothetical protein TRV_01338 [Trichophyton verrucosum HKI 0517]|uniref:Secreted protein n=1 Tax=Trichophyton verrucosum (strain HKI 0517) TaxID=663202 RepID=D4D2N2_TRIVH|nr:uncharacterized protein TRV_01338 [Trichophyton verrucosum HKI 0517]EFE43896.1 hypothetical protein TRV_01338 [Trichophyton verrucosum HKI 0517]
MNQVCLSLALSFCSSGSLSSSSCPLFFNNLLRWFRGGSRSFGGREGCIRDKRSSELTIGRDSLVFFSRAEKKKKKKEEEEADADAGYRRRAPGEGSPVHFISIMNK